LLPSISRKKWPAPAGTSLFRAEWSRAPRKLSNAPVWVPIFKGLPRKTFQLQEIRREESRCRARREANITERIAENGRLLSDVLCDIYHVRIHRAAKRKDATSVVKYPLFERYEESSNKIEEEQMSTNEQYIRDGR